MNTGIFECYEQYRHALRWPFFELAHLRKVKQSKETGYFSSSGLSVAREKPYLCRA